MSKTLRSIVPMIALLLPVAAQASQGPGGGDGTAAPWLQTAMAIAVYGGVAAIFAVGLFGPMRRAR